MRHSRGEEDSHAGIEWRVRKAEWLMRQCRSTPMQRRMIYDEGDEEERQALLQPAEKILRQGRVAVWSVALSINVNEELRGSVGNGCIARKT